MYFHETSSGPCACLGPRNGEPLCPCKMRARRANNHRVYPAPYIPQPVMRGCVCPPGAEATCQGFACPRKPLTIT